jgi:hypothetical protein
LSRSRAAGSAVGSVLVVGVVDWSGLEVNVPSAAVFLPARRPRAKPAASRAGCRGPQRHPGPWRPGGLVQVDGLTTELLESVLPGHGSWTISLPQQMPDSVCPRTGGVPTNRTVAPSAASPLAAAQPTPLVAPVISATLPCQAPELGLSPETTRARPGGPVACARAQQMPADPSGPWGAVAHRRTLVRSQRAGRPYLRGPNLCPFSPARKGRQQPRHGQFSRWAFGRPARTVPRSHLGLPKPRSDLMEVPES